MNAEQCQRTGANLGARPVVPRHEQNIRADITSTELGVRQELIG